MEPEDADSEVTTGDDARTVEDGPAARNKRPSSGSVPMGLVANRYQLVEQLAKGGMGEVMIARDEQIGRDVAIKRMRHAHPSERSQQRFLREASIQGRLAHPAIVKVHEIGRDERGLPFFAMERVEGTTLQDLLAKGIGDQRMRVLRGFAEVCLAIELAHVRGIIHRDLKPANIMFGNFGEVFVLDWGVAKVIGEAEQFADVGSSESGPDATGAGTVVGTPGYMAPEQVQGEVDIDARADVYALGCILFEILAAEPLHPPGKAGLVSALQGIDPRPSVRAPARDIPPELDELCVFATAPDRRDRIASARELGERVQRYLDGDRDLALRRDLATRHLERASQAIEAGDQRRAEAMREAGRALALDPTLVAAAELVTRLMLEPPKTTPPEVEHEIEQTARATARANARLGMWAYIAFAVFSPALLLLAPADFVAALSTLIAGNAVLCWRQSFAEKPEPILIAISNAVLIALVAHMFSPFFIAPAIAALISITIVISNQLPRLVAGVALTLLMSAAILVPWFLEKGGVIAATTVTTDHGLLLTAIGTSSGKSSMLAVAAVYVVLLLATACGFGDAIRTREREAQRRILLQAWQLRQLVTR